jgi:hypothetical protein
MSKPEIMSTVAKKERVRAIAELMVKYDQGKITAEGFGTEHARLMAGMPPTAIFRIMSLYRRMKPPTDEGTA